MLYEKQLTALFKYIDPKRLSFSVLYVFDNCG